MTNYLIKISSLILVSLFLLSACMSYAPGESPSENIWNEWKVTYKPDGWEDDIYSFDPEAMTLDIYYLDGSNQGTFPILELTNFRIKCETMTMKYQMKRNNTQMKLWWYSDKGESRDNKEYLLFEKM